MGRWCYLLAYALSACGVAAAAERVAWTTSHVVGTPEPPLPFRTERVWPTLSFKQPTLLAVDPANVRMYVGEQAGKLWSFVKGDADPTKSLVLDLTTLTLPEDQSVDALYGMAFDPEFSSNRSVYLCYVLKGKPNEVLLSGSRVSRFRLRETDPPTLDPATETLIYTYRAGGHNGGCLEFGPDGCLYISTGDAAGPNPPDTLRTGQDCSDDLSSILRIDVRQQEAGRNYSIPPDNPFVGRAGIRPEIWAYGLRNPWKMTFDRQTGELWVADVGWDQWELVHWVTKGANFGWGAYEGRQPVLPNIDPGPSPMQPPLIELPHSIAASVTGGYVYRGKKFPELRGKYIFGDWETKRIWTAERNAQGAGVLTDLADSGLQIVAFGQDGDGELTIADYGQGVLHQLVRNEVAGPTTPFPRLLSETGLFTKTAEQTPAPGVTPFAINQPQWSDYATAQRWIGLPGTAPIVWHPADRPIPGSMFTRQHDYPTGTVLAKTLSLEMIQGQPESARKIETQLLHFDGVNWRGYTYAWNDTQTDATLVPATGSERTFSVVDQRFPGGKRDQRWAFASRVQCISCHTPWAQHALAFNPLQLHRDVVQDGQRVSQLVALERAGLLQRVDRQQQPLPDFTRDTLKEVPRLAQDDDPEASPQAHLRSYLHVNCSHCHRFNGGGAGSFELLFKLNHAELKLIDESPRQGTYDIEGARLIAPGRSDRSLLYVRMAKFGRGRMPHLGSELVDEQALLWLEQWIAALGSKAAASAPIVAETEAELTHLKSLSAALSLARGIGRGELSSALRERLLINAAQHPSPLVQDLFSGYQPPERRRQTLGTTIRPEAILTLTGDARRGERLFRQTQGVQCQVCHKLDAAAASVGPDLRKLPDRRSRADLLESLLQPSKRIDPKYATHLAQTDNGRVITGLLVSETAEAIVLRDAQGRDSTLRRKSLETLTRSPLSLMPENQLRDLTPQEAADLLSYLESLNASQDNSQ